MSEFVIYETPSELNFLTNTLGVSKLHRSDFYRKFVLPQILNLSKSLRQDALTRILKDLSSLCAANKGFKKFLMKTRFVPNTAGGTLKCRDELCDPDAPELRALMSDKCFPNAEFCYGDEVVLVGLRSLGLRTSLTWDTVLDCAQSIERQAFEQGFAGDGNADLAKSRGRELLSLLDISVHIFFSEPLPVKKRSALFDDSKDLQAHHIDALLCIR